MPRRRGSSGTWCHLEAHGAVTKLTQSIVQHGRPPPPPAGGLGFIILINNLVVAEILDHRVQLDLEPRFEHREVPALWPRRLISVPPIEFVLEDRRMHSFENLPRLLVAAVTRD